MPKNLKKTIAFYSYSVSVLIFSAALLQASFLNAEDLLNARNALSETKDFPQNLETQGSGLAHLITKADILHFKKTARKVKVGSASAEKSEGINRDHSDLLREIKNHNGISSLQTKPVPIHSKNWVLINWGKFLGSEITELTSPLRRDHYISKNLKRLKTPNHYVLREEKGYNLTENDLLRVEEEIFHAGSVFLYTENLNKKIKEISSEKNGQKNALRTHQRKFLKVLENLHSFFYERQREKRGYVKTYVSGLWDKAIMIAYTQNKTVTMRELKKIGNWLQSEEIIYAIDETRDLAKWRGYWRARLRGEQDKKDIDSQSKNPKKNLFPIDPLNILMAKRNKIIFELKKHFEEEKTLFPQLLNPVMIKPHFIIEGNEGGMNLSQNRKSLGELGLMNSFVLKASSAPFSSPNYQLKMNPQTTYVYDGETGHYRLVRPGGVLSSLFMGMEQEVEKGYLYNAYKTALFLFGETYGYVHVNEGGTTDRGFHILETTKTLFSSRKTDRTEIAEKKD